MSRIFWLQAARRNVSRTTSSTNISVLSLPRPRRDSSRRLGMTDLLRYIENLPRADAPEELFRRDGVEPRVAGFDTEEEAIGRGARELLDVEDRMIGLRQAVQR